MIGATATDDSSALLRSGPSDSVCLSQTAYNVSKAGVKVLTEALQHKLRSTPGCLVNAFLLVPGFTATKIITRGQQWLGTYDASKATDEETYEGVSDRAYATERFRQRGAASADEAPPPTPQRARRRRRR